MAIAFETGQIDHDTVSVDLAFEHSSKKRLEGLDATRAFLQERPKTSAIRVEHAIAHGRAGAANGIAILADGTEQRFAYVFDFKNTSAHCVIRVTRYA